MPIVSGYANNLLTAMLMALTAAGVKAKNADPLETEDLVAKAKKYPPTT